MEISGIDLLVMIPLDRSLGDPRQVETLTLVLEGIAGFDLPTSERQVLERTGDDSGILRVSRDPRQAAPVPLAPAERERFLAATPTHQAAHPDVVARARAIIGDETDPLARADRLQSWVFQQLRKDSNADSSTALDVLARQAGDCTEHTMLFVTLARAVGLPAREVGGIVYADLDEPAFGWHAWAEIHDGARWITVDPTWNQVFVDATHIKLRRHDDDMSFINVMGRLRARVIEFTTAK
jgi:transglutaminase-like putative cysteine protease